MNTDIIDGKKLQYIFQHYKNIRKQRRDKFQKEYLSELVQKINEREQFIWKRDVVLLEISNQKRLHWSVAKIIKIFRSLDGCNRVIKIKSSSATLIEPILYRYPN